MTEGIARKSGPSSNLLLLAVAVLIPAPFACVQTVAAQTAPTSQADVPATKPLTYDVVSIRQNNSESGNSDMTTGHNRFSAQNVSLKQMVEFAYDIREDMISGISGPVESARFDVEAKVLEPDSGPPPKLTDKQLEKMLIPLLADRFQMKAHTEIRSLPVYELVLVKGGPKFKPSTGDPQNSSMNMNGVDNKKDLTAKGASMVYLAGALSDEVHRTVIDKTELKGGFDLDLKWAPADLSDSQPGSALSIFTALQEQLGLKLQPAKGPVPTLVVGHVEMPSEN
jgi:bla regulator protein BlaR1